MRVALAMVLVVATLTAACPSTPPPRVDAGGFISRDAGLHRGDTTLPLSDTGIDAFVWPDAGPQPPPVLPPQSWTMSVSATADTFLLTINLDARAESGLVRAVAGAGGRSSNLVYDVLPNGVLRPRGAIVMGLPGIHTCGQDTVALEDLRLQFSDVDGDGLREALTSASSVGLVTRTGPMMPSQGSEVVVVSAITRDATPPTVSVLDPELLAGLEPLVLLASEPIAPAFMPTLTGARTVMLEADTGASAAARWSIDTSTLPVGHYVLTLTPPEDVSGHTALAPLPMLAFDVVAPAPLGIDGVDTRVDGVVSSVAPVILGDDPGETAIEGATSLLVGARSALSFTLATAGSHSIELWLRVAGPAGYTPSMVSVLDAGGALLGQQMLVSELLAPGTTHGFAADTSPQPVQVSFTTARAGRFYVLIEAVGPRDQACGVGTLPTGTFGAVVDSVRLF